MQYARELHTSEPVILVSINQTYQPNMNDAELYEATRKWWVVGKRRERAKYAVATYRGKTLEAYEIHEWYPEQYQGRNRWVFRGEIADRHICRELVEKSVKHLRKQGNSNPIFYLNC